MDPDNDNIFLMTPLPAALWQMLDAFEDMDTTSRTRSTSLLAIFSFQNASANINIKDVKFK